VKFTENGEVVVAVTHEQQAWRFEVADTGVGMSDHQLAGLFQPFHQADASTSRRFGGTGLGLSIAHRLATQMGGNISATSIPGKGSRFTVLLPLPAQAAAPRPPLPRNALVLLASRNGPHSPVEPQLQQWNLDIMRLENISTDTRRQIPPSIDRPAALVIEMEGAELRRLHALMAAWPQLPVLAIIPPGANQLGHAALSAGAKEILEKPIVPGTLHAALSRIWKPSDSAQPIGPPLPETYQQQDQSPLPPIELLKHLRELRDLVENGDFQAQRLLSTVHPILVDSFGAEQIQPLVEAVRQLRQDQALQHIDQLLTRYGPMPADAPTPAP